VQNNSISRNSLPQPVIAHARVDSPLNSVRHKTQLTSKFY